MNTGAQFSEDRVYRYVLWRTWAEDDGHMMFVGLNPSTADEMTDDPTIRRCIAFAKREGYGGIYMLNLFAYCSTDPKGLYKAQDPVGPENAHFLRTYYESAGITVATWGNHGKILGRSATVRSLLPNLWCFGLTKSCEPKHPLYLPKNADLYPLE